MLIFKSKLSMVREQENVPGDTIRWLVVSYWTLLVCITCNKKNSNGNSAFIKLFIPSYIQDFSIYVILSSFYIKVDE